MHAALFTLHQCWQYGDTLHVKLNVNEHNNYCGVKMTPRVYIPHKSELVYNKLTYYDGAQQLIASISLTKTFYTLRVEPAWII